MSAAPRSADPRRAGPRGLTLVELMVAITVSSLTVFAAMTLLMQQQRAYQATSADRSEQEAGRMALREITRRTRMAGYGVDSNLVLDFGSTPSVPRPNMKAPATSVAFTRWACGADVRCRDSTTSAASDELVFLTRDPMFSRVATAVTAASVTVMGQLKQTLYPGQLLQISCMGGTRARAYVTVGTEAPSPVLPAVANPLVTQTIQLQAGSTTGGKLTFGLENDTLTDTCFAIATVGQQPIVTAVDRTRFYVAWYNEAGGGVVPQTANARPYLMLDRGLTGNGATPLPIAPDVEDLQVSYLYGPAAAGNAQREVGRQVGTNIADEAFAVTTAVVPPAFDDAPDAASRITGHPANINGIRIAVVVRSSEQDISRISDEDRTVPLAGNRDKFLGQPNYRRSLFETTVFLRNLQVTSFVYPNVNPAGGTGFNLGGG